MKNFNLNSSIEELVGVGPVKSKQLAKLGIFTIRDMIYTFPRLYEERGNIFKLSDLDTASPHGYILTVATQVVSSRTKQGMSISKFKAFDESGTVEVIFFNSPFVKDVFHVGEEFRFWGKLSLSKNTLQLTSPKYEAYSEQRILPYFVPVYPLTHGITSSFLNKLSASALSIASTEIIDPLPENIRIKYKLPTLNYSLKNIHFPPNSDALRTSVKRIAFDEMLYFGLGISKSAHQKNLEPV